MTRCENGHGAGGVDWSDNTARRGCHTRLKCNKCSSNPEFDIVDFSKILFTNSLFDERLVVCQWSCTVNAPFAACGNNEPTGDGWWRLLYVSATFAAWLSANAFTFMLKGLSQCLSITWALFWHVVMKCYRLVSCIHWSVNVHVVFTSADPSLYCDGG